MALRGSKAQPQLLEVDVANTAAATGWEQVRLATADHLLLMTLPGLSESSLDQELQPRLSGKRLGINKYCF